MGSEENAATEVDFSGVVNALPALVWTTLSDGRSDFVNRLLARIYGSRARCELVRAWMAEGDPSRRFGVILGLLERHPAIRASPKEIDGRLRRCDGEYRWFVFRPSFNGGCDRSRPLVLARIDMWTRVARSMAACVASSTCCPGRQGSWTRPAYLNSATGRPSKISI